MSESVNASRLQRRSGPLRAPYVLALWAATSSLLLSGCEFGGLQDVQLPGGAASDGNAYRVTVEFRDVLDLVPQSSVKVNNVTVGAVEKVELHGWRARVRLRIADSTKLPANAVADLRQTSILGEKYVALAKPADVRPAGKLTDGDTIPLSRSNRNAEIEEVLSALSALLNGGGVAQLHTITKELNHTLKGRESRIKSLLAELDTFIGGLNKQRSQIVRAMKGIDRLAKKLAKQRKTVEKAVDTMPSALKVLADQRRNLTAMLKSLSKLGKVGSRVVKASRNDVVANLKNLRPILSRLNEAGDDLPNALELMTTYPFPRNVVGAIKGDYVNLKITADLDPNSLYRNVGPNKPGRPGSPGPDLPGIPDIPGVPTPDLPDLPDLPDPGNPCIPALGCSEKPDEGGSSGGSGGGGVLCPPVCTSSYASYTGSGSGGSGDGSGGSSPVDSASRYGIDIALAQLMTRGMRP
jgi:phospholipid/cholesterol/gamma-HCH transport system substrate-binding protein